MHLSIQVPSKFFYEWLEEHYVKLLKVALTKELGPGAKLLYKIKMENTYGNKLPFTEQIPLLQQNCSETSRSRCTNCE
jgi:chromosomal replication initiator protein